MDLGEHVMREKQITTPEIGLIAGTRAALGAGLGLLLAGRLSDEQRRAIGWTLVTFGILTTIPLAIEVFGNPRTWTMGNEPEEGSRNRDWSREMTGA
jgi:hypothetical protein